MHQFFFRLLENQYVNHYHLRSLLSASGFGGVFRATEVVRDLVMSQRALKLFPYNDDEFERQLRALQVWLNLHHDHLLECYSCGVCNLLGNEYLYFVMELADYSLQSHLQEQEKLSEAKTRQVLQHTASALVSLHSQGYIHRDIKPGNIFWFEQQQRWKVSDLDLIIYLNESSMDFGSIGTLYYMPPESFQTGTDANTPISAGRDIWALGIMTVQLLTGDFPFHFTSENEFFTNYQITIPPLPDPFERIVQGCLQRECEKRWTAQQVLDALVSD